MKNYGIWCVCLLLLTSITINAQQKDSALLSGSERLYDYNRPTFKLNKEQLKNENRFLRFSILTGYREGVTPLKEFGTTSDQEHGTVRIYMVNLSIQDMLNMNFYQPNNRVILEVKDPLKYRYTSSQGNKIEWMRKNAYCFEYLIPYGFSNSVKIVRDELAHYFNVSFGFENRTVNVLVLKRTSDQDKIGTKGNIKSSYDGKSKLQNMPLKTLVQLFDNIGLPPLIDETRYIGNVDLEVGKNNDLSSIRKRLMEYDLELKEEKREIEMFVIHENQKAK